MDEGKYDAEAEYLFKKEERSQEVLYHISK